MSADTAAGQQDGIWDVAILGGGAAGLSAALTLARARRSVVVIDAGDPRNAPAAAAHGLIGQEGINPLELLASGRREAASYGAEFRQGTVAAATAIEGGGFTLGLDGGVPPVKAGQILVATGVNDELPEIPGLAGRWGRDVVHCPYCHGWEIRDQRIGLLGTGPMSAMQALLFHQWSEQLWFLPNGVDYPGETLAKLRAVGIRIVDAAVVEVEVDVARDALTGVRLDDGGRVALDALAVPAMTTARLTGLEGLGLEMADSAAGVAVVVDSRGQTSVPGVWAAGNVVNHGMQVSEAAANGARVAMTINTEMVFARAERAIRAARTSVVDSGVA